MRIKGGRQQQKRLQVIVTLLEERMRWGQDQEEHPVPSETHYMQYPPLKGQMIESQYSSPYSSRSTAYCSSDSTQIIHNAGRELDGPTHHCTGML